MLIYQTKFTEQAKDKLGIDNPDVCYEDLGRLIKETYSLFEDADPSLFVNTKITMFGREVLFNECPASMHANRFRGLQMIVNYAEEAMKNEHNEIEFVDAHNRSLGVKIVSIELIEK